MGYATGCDLTTRPLTIERAELTGQLICLPQLNPFLLLMTERRNYAIASVSLREQLRDAAKAVGYSSEFDADAYASVTIDFEVITEESDCATDRGNLIERRTEYKVLSLVGRVSRAGHRDIKADADVIRQLNEELEDHDLRRCVV